MTSNETSVEQPVDPVKQKLFQLNYKLKIARHDKERTAKKLQEAWDADNRAQGKIDDLEAHIAALLKDGGAK